MYILTELVLINLCSSYLTAKFALFSTCLLRYRLISSGYPCRRLIRFGWHSHLKSGTKCFLDFQDTKGSGRN
ncbi:hypothetical protein CT0861_05860 [Colletotrichum tofieldiae]|uniref:Uncharacterized protein n=1 Tax=Colletotrichum tofieldiae TaxID=708197 RepID=A0A161VWZ4_9PEZI|nr:hypothetical protein CT0861_05860 [Colletotrichum tofieldiae]